MNWLFPLKDYKYTIPELDHPGSFLQKRKHHFHEGVDLHCEEDSLVVSVEEGIVHKIINFTGKNTNSDWWNETQAIVVKGESGFVLYGEIEVGDLKVGDRVKKGQTLGKVKKVLKKYKGNPQSMLHIELYKDYFNQPIELLNEKDIDKEIKDFGLVDPTSFLQEALQKDNILLMVSGSISAYKSIDLARSFQKRGYHVKVILTQSAENFVKKEVFGYFNIDCYSTDEDKKGIIHIELARWADKVLIAPCSANTLSKLSHGLADNLLTSTWLALKQDVIKIVMPVMNSEMLNKKVIQENISKLDCSHIIYPKWGVLACEEEGYGKILDTKETTSLVETFGNNIVNKKVLITAGATIAPLDSIRFLTNPAKGASGLLLAQKFLQEGYKVDLIVGHFALKEFDILESHPRCNVTRIKTTRDLFEDVKKKEFDIYISPMAVSDLEFDVSQSKIKKSSLNDLKIKISPDVLDYVVKNKKENQCIVGFAAESELTAKVLNEKLKRKPVDLLVANVANGGLTGQAKGFSSNANEYNFISYNRNELYQLDKKGLADRIFSHILEIS